MYIIERIVIKFHSFIHAKMNLHLVINMYLILCNVAIARISKIIGGEDAEINEFPYIASLRLLPKNVHFCGGAIISEWHVLTAAHCLLGLKPIDFKVCIGSNDIYNLMICYKIQHIMLHPKFDKKRIELTGGNDIAVITVDEYIIFNDYQNKIDLPKNNNHSGEFCMTVGWGWTSFPMGKLFNKLQKISMKIISNVDCVNVFPQPIYDQQICAFQKEGAGTCFGDSGGPLVSNGQVIGISSFARPCATGIPDVYTRVYSYLNFIKTSMNLLHNFQCCPTL